MAKINKISVATVETFDVTSGDVYLPTVESYVLDILQWYADRTSDGEEMTASVVVNAPIDHGVQVSKTFTVASVAPSNS